MIQLKEKTDDVTAGGSNCWRHDLTHRLGNNLSYAVRLESQWASPGAQW